MGTAEIQKYLEKRYNTTAPLSGAGVCGSVFTINSSYSGPFVVKATCLNEKAPSRRLSFSLDTVEIEYGASRVILHTEFPKVVPLAPETATHLQQSLLEVKILERLAGKHVPTVFGSYYVAGRGHLYFCQEQSIASGLPLAHLEASVHERQNIAKQLCEAVAYLHTLDIVHGDLTPSHCYYERSRGCTIIDFGGSRCLSGPSSLSWSSPWEEALLMDPDIVEMQTPTLGYMSPEQYNLEELAASDDVFSLGVILAELFLGRQILQQDHIKNYQNHIPERIVRDLSHCLPAHVVQAIGKSLSPNPLDRSLNALQNLFH